MSAMQLAGPLVLFFLMTIVGMELTPADFRRVVAAPRAVVGGTLAQLLGLPLLTWAVVASLDVPPVLAAGALLVAASPGAGMSNVLAAVSRANVALSVTLTALASVLAVLTLPAVSALAMRVFLGDALEVRVPVAELMGQLAFSVLAPIGLGMWLRSRRPHFAAHHSRRLQRLALALIALVVVVGVATNDDSDIAFVDLQGALPAAALWTALSMAGGFAVARLLRLPAADCFTFLIEFSSRNIAVTAIVALSGLARADLAFFGAAYAVVGFPMVMTAALLRRRALG